MQNFFSTSLLSLSVKIDTTDRNMKVAIVTDVMKKIFDWMSLFCYGPLRDSTRRPSLRWSSARRAKQRQQSSDRLILNRSDMWDQVRPLQQMRADRVFRPGWECGLERCGAAQFLMQSSPRKTLLQPRKVQRLEQLYIACRKASLNVSLGSTSTDVCVSVCVCSKPPADNRHTLFLEP